ncbi:MAG TPA: TetR/AcrR family transcriptional regulator [Pseudolysinimonas sp.]
MCGYEQTSIQDVLDALTISKGAFYHYFDSKQALLLALVDRRSDMLEQSLVPLVEDQDLSAIDKVVKFFVVQDEFKRQRRQFVLEVAHTWHSDGNAVFRRRLSAEGRRRLDPLLVQVIAQGVAEKSFAVEDPEQVARIIMSMIDGLAEAVAESLDGTGTASGSSTRAALVATTDAIERVLGTTQGVLQEPWLDALSRW